MLEPGAQIDIWVVERSLGRGGMGSVYRCHNRTASRILAAVKVLEHNLSQYPEAEARFIREAEILFQLDHPNIVKVRNIRTDMSPPYLEMEFVEGESLEDKLQRGPLPFLVALELMRQISGAVAYLHRRGVCHRDIKPANLLVKNDGRVKLVDFGLAMEADVSRITEQGVAFGTVSYAPPEWITPDSLVATRWDIYSAGVVFYEMLTGKVAFPVSGQGSARQQAMQVIVGKQHHKPLDPGPEFPDEVRALIAEMTDSDDLRRLGDCRLAYERLGALQASLGEDALRVMTVSPDPLEGVDDADSVVLDAPGLAMPRRPDTDTWPGDTPTPVAGDVRTEPHTLPTPASLDDDLVPRRSRLAVAGLVGVGVGLLVALAVVLLAVRQLLAGPVPRPVNVVLTGLPAETSAAVRIGGMVPVSVEGAVYGFPGILPGQYRITWVLGPRCPPLACPGDACPVWCGVGEQALTVSPGDEVLVETVALSPPPARSIAVRVPALAEVDESRFVLGAVEGEADGERVRFEGVLPGPHLLTASLGVCPETAAGCWPDGDCPAGCASYRGELVVPWEGEPDAALEIPAPEAPARPRGRKGRSGGAVTRAELARWLADNPDWQAPSAIAAGRAAPGYLEGWSGATPPPGTGAQAATHVSWFAAAAFCRARGGLADKDAPPLRWSESSSRPYMEWRADDGRAAWRMNDGRSSVQNIDMKSHTGLTGFRCAR